ncbi:class I SAM-dependent methyltransferase [Acuticoccus kandeliae]|uniref:class I SAM-dependent methyltransferase n=1 Tax=Acuticoccus kandeliae TaxID=2073160 RepID=UPI000D3E717B|nr:class I SAM-dependent methyltransferase [Acuticoccus kandeliae]
MDANKAQAAYWTSPAGLKWIEHEAALDAAMAGMLAAMLDAAAITPTDRVLDIGCGTGASTLAAAERAARGTALGVDISEPLLTHARGRARAARAANAAFLLADAQSYPFAPGAFDVLVSRIGMSFFSDTVAALRNLGVALGGGGRMAFVAWAGVAENPWFHIPKRAAEARFGPQPAGDPVAPGPTAFQDRDRVAGLMAEAGLTAIMAERVEIALTPPGGTEGAARAASRVGPAARIMKACEGKETDAAAIEAAVCTAFEPYACEDGVRVPAVVNIFTATA